jgi:hypothetical protein
MKRTLLVLAYFLIWSTPFQVGFILWAVGVLFTTDATLLSLTNDLFMGTYLPFFHDFLKPVSYFVLPDFLADFVWSLPAILHGSFKAIVNTALGMWLLPIAKEM